MPELLRLDATALALIGHDVAMIPDTAMDHATPCAGWSVADLVRHMNERHEAVTTMALPPLDPPAGGGDRDPRFDFARIGARWITAVDGAGDTVQLPKAGPMAAEQVLSVHIVDMLTHRWDLARALRRPCPVPQYLLDFALPVARRINAPGSPLGGPDGVYREALGEDRTLSAMDNIAALLGRKPR